MKKPLKWFTSICVGLLLTNAITRCSSESKDNTNTTQISNPDKTESPEVKIKTKDNLLALRVDSILQTRNLSLCELYHWAEKSEATIRHDMEAKYGMANAMKMVEQRNKVLL